MANCRLFLVSMAALSTLTFVVGCSKDESRGKGGGTGGTSHGTETEPTTVIGTVPVAPGVGGSVSIDVTSVTAGTGSTSPVVGTGSVTVLTEAQVTKLQGSACNAWSIEPESVPVKIEFIIDISGSMNTTTLGTQQTKWEATRDALVDAIVGTTAGTGLGANTSVGLLFYPGKVNQVISDTPLASSTECLDIETSVPMAALGAAGVAGGQRELISDALNAVVLGQGTPTHDAYAYALNSVVLSEEQIAIPGQPYLLLITDGAPTLEFGCFNSAGSLSEATVPTQPIVDEVANAYDQGIKTFVIGSPGSEGAVAWLSAAASAGGTAKKDCSNEGPTYCHMDMTTAPSFSDALRDNLSEVTAKITGCKFEVPTESSDGKDKVDPTLVKPVITFSTGVVELLGLDTTSACAGEGFRLNSPIELELCPATCNRLQADGLAGLQFMFNCAQKTIDDIIQ